MRPALMSRVGLLVLLALRGDLSYAQTDTPEPKAEDPSLRIDSLTPWQMAAVFRGDLKSFFPEVATAHNTPLKFKAYTNSVEGQERLRTLRLLRNTLASRPVVFRTELTPEQIGEFSIEERSFLIRWNLVRSDLPCYNRPDTRKVFERIPFTDREVYLQNLPWLDPSKQDPSASGSSFLFPVGPMTEEAALAIEGVRGISLEIVYLITGVEFPEDADGTDCRPFVLVGHATAFRLVAADGKTLFAKSFPPPR